MRIVCLCLVIFLLFESARSAVLIATTEDGRKVILKEDGSWKFADQSDLDAHKKAPETAGFQPATAVEKPDNDRTQTKPQAPDEPERAKFLDVIQGDRSFDVRKALWGMEKSEVKKSEMLRLLKETQSIVEYQFKLIGLDSKILYQFSPDKSGKSRLCAAQYFIEQDDVNPARFFEDYQSLKEYLEKLYGPSVSNENRWTNDIYRADEKNWGFAISLGFLTCTTTWKNARTRIVLSLSGGNHLINTKIEYRAL